METFESIKDKGLLIFSWIRGSHSYGLNIETSDVDTSAIYVLPNDYLYGLSENYQDMVQDKKGDNTWYEIGKFMQMLIKSNPTVLEALFVDEQFITYEHPIFTEIKKHRQEFVTKDCFNAFIGYAYDQIKKARGLNKKIVQEPIKEHLQPLDFCYTFYRQGSTHILNFLSNRGLKQKYCGLVNIPNMTDMYGVYYDFGNHMIHEDWKNDALFIKFAMDYFNPNWFVKTNKKMAIKFLESHCKPIGYSGMVKETDDIYIENIVGAPKIFDLRLSAIDDKNTKPICFMSYNSSGYTDHCIKWKQYKEWETNRNPARFIENKDCEFDRKNMAHCVRLLHMGIEIATKGEVHVNRANIDREFILDIRRGKTDYATLIDYVEKKMSLMKEAMAKSTLPEHINKNTINDLLVFVRKNFNPS